MVRDRFQRIRTSPALYPGVADALGPSFPWHTHAASARSSQALCLSVWVPLAGLAERHAVVEALLTAALPHMPRGDGDRAWTIAVEVSRPPTGTAENTRARSTRVDVLLDGGSAVVALESKYLSDAVRGVDRCPKYPVRCFGPDDLRREAARVDRDRPIARVRADGPSPWCDDVARRFFRVTPDAGTRVPEGCRLARFHQLVHALSLAAEVAGQRERESSLPREPVFYGAVVMAPAATGDLLQRQVAELQDDVLLPHYAGRIGVLHYERLANALLRGGEEAQAVGAFLAAKLEAAKPPSPSATPRGTTVREMRLRAGRLRRH